MAEQEDRRSEVERRIVRSLEDPSGTGRPLSRRARQTRRSVEAYIKGGVVPRYMERLRDIDAAVDLERRRIDRRYRQLREGYGDDAQAFAKRWHDHARNYRFDSLNELIREHNEWYPVESQLPMDPRTRDYVGIRGRTYRRPELGPEWVLEHFPATPPD